MKHTITLLLFILLGICNCIGQTIHISGRATDHRTGEAIEFANVVALSDKSIPISFCATDSMGNFTLTLNEATDSVRLRVTCIGYHTWEKTVALPVEALNLRLRPAAERLQEVKMKGRAPGLRVRGDTIDYQFRKYTDGTETVLADVLAKLPGIEVDKKGQVRANGKAVEKIMVNGQDFFSGQNEQVTKNLPADFVDKIQLNQNYSEYSWLDGFNTRKSTVINVEVDSVHRGRVTGGLEAWGGYRDKHREALQLYSFGSKVMWGVNVHDFNTGEEMMSLIDYVKTIGGVKAYADFFEGETSVVDNGMSTLSYMENSNDTWKRDNRTVSASLAWNPDEATRINAYCIYNGEQNWGDYKIERFFTANGTTSLLEQTDNRQRHFCNLGLTLQRRLSPSASLSLRSYLVATPQKADHSENNIAWNTNGNGIQSTTLLSFAKRWGNHTLLTFNGNYILSHEWHRIDTALDSLIALSASPVMQRRTLSTQQANLGSSLVRRIARGWQLRGHIAFNWMRTGVRAKSNQPQYRCDLQEDIAQAYAAGLFVDKTQGTVKTQVGTDLIGLHTHSASRSFAVCPLVKLEWTPSPIHSFSISFKRNVKRDNDEKFARLLSITDYQHVRRFDGEVESLRLHDNIQLTYHYFDIIPDFTLIAYAGRIWTHHPAVTNYTTDGSITLTSYSDGDKARTVNYGYLSVRKGFPFRVIFSGKVNYQQSDYQTIYNRQTSNDRWTQWSGEGAFTSRMKCPFNVEVGGRWEWKESLTGLYDYKVHLVSWQAYVKPMVTKKGTWDLSLPLTYLSDKVNGETYHYWNLSLSGHWKIGRFTLQIEASNMFYLSHFRRMNVSTYQDYIETRTENWMPGFIIAGVRWRI